MSGMRLAAEALYAIAHGFTPYHVEWLNRVDREAQERIVRIEAAFKAQRAEECAAIYEKVRKCGIFRHSIYLQDWLDARAKELKG